MRKTYSIEQIHSTKFTELSPENARIFLLSLLQHLEVEWHSQPLRMQLIKQLVNCLQEASQPGLINAQKHRFAEFASCMRQQASIKQFLSLAVPLERELGGCLSEHEFLIDSCDKQQKAAPASQAKRGLFIVADNLRSAFNIGSVFRTSECIGALHIYLCGYTSGPDSARTRKAAMGTEALVPWSWKASAMEAIAELQAKGIPCFALETASPSKSLFSFTFPGSCGLVIGNERYGLDASLLAACDNTIKVPVYGCKNSLNVGVCMAVAAYEFKRQQHKLKP